MSADLLAQHLIFCALASQSQTRGNVNPRTVQATFPVHMQVLVVFGISFFGVQVEGHMFQHSEEQHWSAEVGHAYIMTFKQTYADINMMSACLHFAFGSCDLANAS
jgi:hypothetical protein